MWGRHIALQLVDLRMEHQDNRFMGCDYNIDHVQSRVKRCRSVKDRSRL
jgi:hypothetical protein